jgi:hypothetical protein
VHLNLVEQLSRAGAAEEEMRIQAMQILLELKVYRQKTESKTSAGDTCVNSILATCPHGRMKGTLSPLGPDSYVFT